MELKIYNQNDELKLTVEPSDNSTRQKSIQADHVLSLSFTSFEFVRLDVNDYVEFLGQRFWIIEQYIPKQVSTVEWEYNCRFYGPENLIGQALVLKIVDGEDDPVFSLTAPAQVHVELVVENLNRQMGTTDWKVGEVIATGNITIDYKGTYCNAGLEMIAEKAETEYWIDGMTVNLCRCEYGEAIPLGYDNGALSIEVSSADNVKFFTRLFPVGSSRNIDRSVYGHTRLQLPDGQKYIERDVELGVVEHYEEAAFAHIYPRRVGTISVVRSEVKTNEDGTPFTIYYFEDMELPFNPNEYEIGGLVKQITFQSGELNGRDFEVNYNSEVGEFEIITQWPYDDDTQIPGGTLIPKAGDEYILWNIRMPNEYYDLASQEYAEAVDAYMAKHRKDHRVYKVPTNYVDIERRGLVFDIGQRIRLESAEHFVDGYRDSRISSFSQNVNIPTMYDLEISDVISMGTVTQIKSDVNEIRNFTQTTAASLPGIIRSWENTPASDFNLFSAKKQVVEFLSKRNGGQVLGIVSFLRDIILGGNAQTTDFVKGNIGGSGAGLYRDESGNTVFEADKLIVRQEASFNELTINQISFQLGETVFSAGGCTITKVGDGSDFYRCYYDNKEGNRYSGFQVGDYARCQQFDAANQVQTKYYWRLVVNVGDDYVDLSKADCDGTGIPATGDDIVQFGNRLEVARQSAVVISPHSGGSIVILSGVDSYSLVGKNYVGMGVDAATGEAYIYGYGRMFFGDRGEGQYIKYEKGDDGEYHLQIYADVTLGASSDLSESTQFAELEEQVAGKTESHYDDYDGGKDVLADEWAESGTEAEHEGDIFTNTETGATWHWLSVWDGNQYSYQWVATADVKAQASIANIFNQEVFTRADIQSLQTEYQKVYTESKDLINRCDEFDVDYQQYQFEAIANSYLSNISNAINLLAENDSADASLVSDDRETYYEAVKEVREELTVSERWRIENARTDLDYLKQVFPNSLLDVNGATLSLMLGVKDSSDNVVAGLYGGGSAILNDNDWYDPDKEYDTGTEKGHGTLMIFAGLTDIDDPTTATTRIYEDGTIYTNKLIATNADISGKIVSGEGNIGGFEIDGNSLEATKTPFSNHVAKMYLSASYIRFTDDLNDSLVASMYLGVGRGGWPGENNAVTGLLQIDIDCNLSHSHTGATIEVKNAYNTNTALKLSASSEHENARNYALYAEQGDIFVEQGRIIGLRPNISIVTSGTTLSPSQNVVLCNNASAMTLTLPSSAYIGQMYIIRRLTSNANVTIKAPSGYYIVSGNRSMTEAISQNPTITLSGYHAVELHYAEVNDKKIWVANYMAYNI